MIEFAWTGVDAIAKKLQVAASQIAVEAAGALKEEAEVEMTEAKRRTPVDTGALRASGHVTEPRATAHDVEVDLRFGGPAAPYSVPVHENLEALHPVGQAKYLESVVLESAPHLASRVAKRIDLRRAVR